MGAYIPSLSHSSSIIDSRTLARLSVSRTTPDECEAVQNIIRPHFDEDDIVSMSSVYVRLVVECIHDVNSDLTLLLT